MKTYALKIRSLEDEKFVIDILNALEIKHLIDLLPMSYLGLAGEIISEESLRESVLIAESSKSYSLEEAKKYLGL